MIDEEGEPPEESTDDLRDARLLAERLTHKVEEDGSHPDGGLSVEQLSKQGVGILQKSTQQCCFFP